MEAVALLAAAGVALFCDFIGFKYKAVMYFVLGGVITLFGLANLIADGSLTLYSDLVQASSTFAPYKITAAGDLPSMGVIAAAVSVFAVAQFLFAIDLSFGGEKE